MMNSKAMLKTVVTLLATGLMINANANSVGFDQDNYSGTIISVSVIYDFTDFAMFGGGVDIEYDPNALLFIDYTQGPLAADVVGPASPVGSLTAPGLYSGPGIGTWEAWFWGINSAGTIGTLTFNVLGTNDPGATSCGLALCLLRNNLNPFVSVAGSDVNDELFANGISGANIALPVSVPAATWLMLSGLIGIIGFGRRSK